jgi:ELWxxDGT repeat protein
MSLSFKKLLFALITFGISQVSFSQGVRMVKDINVQGNTYSGNPTEFTEYKNGIIFQANSLEYGTEIFQFNNDSVKILVDVKLGSEGSNASNFCVIGDTILFSADRDFEQGKELWMYNGRDQPYLLHDIRLGTKDSDPYGFLHVNDKVYFAAYIDWGNELFELNLLTDSIVLIESTHAGALAKILELTLYKDELYYVANDNRDLIKYDFNNSPVLVPESKAIEQLTYTSNLVEFDDKLCFLKKNGDSNQICYITSTSDSILPFDNVLIPDENPVELFALDSVLFIGTYGKVKKAIWIYDEVNGLVKILDTEFENETVSFDFKFSGDKLYFQFNASNIYTYNVSTNEMLKAFDTEGSKVKTIKEFGAFTNYGIVLNATDSIFGYEFYQYSNDTLIYHENINAKTRDGNPYFFNTLNNKMIFSANNGINGYELWEYDGINSPSMVYDINPGNESGVNSTYKRVFNNKLYFSGYNDEFGDELWCYDGINSPYLVKDLVPGTDGQIIRDFIEFNGELYFAFDDGFHGEELWKMNSNEEFALAWDINIGGKYSSSQPEYFTIFKEKLAFFAGSNGSKNIFLFDGINPPVKAVSDCDPFCENQQRGLTEFNGKLYYSAYKTNYGSEFWTYDGENTSLVADLLPGEQGSSPNYITPYKESLYFSAGFPEQIYRYNESSGITNLSEQWAEGLTAGVLFKVIHNKLYFRANGPKGAEMYEYNGYSDPILVTDINPFGSSNAIKFHEFNDKVYFKAGDGIHGQELWEYDPYNCNEVIDLVANACDFYNSPTGKYIWDTSGVYTDTIFSDAGFCDTLFIVDLFVGDNIVPVYNGPDTLIFYLNDSCYFQIDSLKEKLEITDNCGNESIDVQQNIIGWFEHRTFQDTIVELRISDEGNNTIYKNIRLLFTDTIKPVIDSIPSKEADFSLEDCNYILPDFRGDIKVFENCIDVISVSQYPKGSSIIADTGLHQIKFVAIDQFGNMSDTAIMNLQINLPSNKFYCKGDVSYALNGACKIVVPDYSTNYHTEGFCNNEIEVSQIPEAGQEIEIKDSLLMIELVAKDNHDSIYTCSFNMVFSNFNEYDVDTTVCKGFSLDSELHYNNVGEYQYTENKKNSCGKDSIVNWTIRIDSIESNIKVNDDRLVVNSSSAINYQWLDCDNNSVLNQGPNNYFSPTYNGFYSVIVETSECSVTSECIAYKNDNYFNVDLKNHIKISPNPFDSRFEIDFSIYYEEVEITMYSVYGELLFSEQYSNVKRVKYNLEPASGVYFVQIKSGSDLEVFQVVSM